MRIYQIHEVTLSFHNYRKTITSFFFKILADGAFKIILKECTSISYHISGEKWEKNENLLNTILDIAFYYVAKWPLHRGKFRRYKAKMHLIYAW